jgi:Flp pilus assembly protein TadG
MLLRAPHKDQNGVAAVEFAVVLPILVIILLGIFDFALLFYNKQVLTNASREGARAAIVVDNRSVDDDPETITGGDLTALQNIIYNYCNGDEYRLINLGGGSNALVNPPVFDIDATDPDNIYITATVTYEYDHLFFSFFGIGPTSLTGRTVMRSE